MLTQAGEVDALRSSLQPTAGDLLDKYGYLPLRILADAEVTPTGTDIGSAKENFSWTRSYAELARWVVNDLPSRVAAELDSVVTSQRSQLLQEGARISGELPELEAASVASMDGAVHSVLEGVPLPVVLLRRSGEVYAKNTLASNTFGLLQPSAQDNFIKYGLGQHAVSIAKVSNSKEEVGREGSDVLRLTPLLYLLSPLTAHQDCHYRQPQLRRERHRAPRHRRRRVSGHGSAGPEQIRAHHGGKGVGPSQRRSRQRGTLHSSAPLHHLCTHTHRYRCLCQTPAALSGSWS